MFKKIDPKIKFPEMEKEILKFWEKNQIFEKSVQKESPKGDFIFYEGPPTANGTPGLHHVLARAFKDIIPRYKTMKGYRVERKAGWDTHGLPVEIQVEKELGIHQKSEIENIVPGNPRESIIEFNKKCKESVWKYKDLWEQMTRRMGYWVDMKNPYVTYKNEYIESVWWVISQIAKLKTDKNEPVLYQGHKVIPYCYRCGTALSSHEVAQGYQKVKDNSVYVKFKAKPNPEKGIDDNTYFLVWTTTPWTLPGNVALAVNKDIEYSIRESNTSINRSITGGEIIITPGKYIIATELVGDLAKEGNYFTDNVKNISGKDLLELEYEPLYKTNDTNKKAYYVISGDFVTTQDGTGIVHIAPAFGEDDSRVGQENNLPTIHTVDIEGKISADIPGKGIPVKKKNAQNKYAVDDLIIEDLKKRGLLFKEESYEHDYPFCWRCDTPLIYYAKPSWFVRMSAFREVMEKNNQNIDWIPEYIKEGRFGEWLRDAKDWAISRDRYWGTPLPIWKCKKCGKIKVVESIDEIREQLGNPNRLFLMRHGQANNNVEKILMTHPEKGKNPLAEEGKNQIEEAAEYLLDKKIDIIFSSPIQRAMETAQIISKKIGAEIISDERITEIECGKFEGKSWKEYMDLYPQGINPGKTDSNGIECLEDIEKRMSQLIEEINEKYKGKNIVIVSHGGPLRVMSGILKNMSKEEILDSAMNKNGEIEELYSKSFDLHKPYIDEVILPCECGSEMKREPEVMDVWFDSGSMPTAQFHYPSGASKEDKKKIESGKYYPADYISEAIDQTRGWFYTLHAISTLLNCGKKVPTGYAYKNVICLGHILDAQGKKMSKSKGNIVDPMEIMDKYGADMLRWMLYTMNQPGLPKRFDIKKMNDIMNRVFRMLWNSYSFFVMYANIDKFEPSEGKYKKSENLLDKWIISECNRLVDWVTFSLDRYDIHGAGESIEEFIDNLSNWYIRRSRKRFWKSEDDADKKSAYQTLHTALITLSKIMAPFTPFIAEEIYKNLTGKESVHLAEYPQKDKLLVDAKLNKKMFSLRLMVTAGLNLRAEAKIKVRQPLQKAVIRDKGFEEELLEILKDELNVKEIEINNSQEELIILDTNITEDLKLEGQAREIIRHIQEMRKEAGYEVDNRIGVAYNGMSVVFEKFGDLIAKETLANSLNKGKMENPDLSKDFTVDGEKLTIQIKR